MNICTGGVIKISTCIRVVVVGGGGGGVHDGLFDVIHKLELKRRKLSVIISNRYW